MDEDGRMDGWMDGWVRQQDRPIFISMPCPLTLEMILFLS